MAEIQYKTYFSDECLDEDDFKVWTKNIPDDIVNSIKIV